MAFHKGDKVKLKSGRTATVVGVAGSRLYVTGEGGKRNNVAAADVTRVDEKAVHKKPKKKSVEKRTSDILAEIT